MTSLCTVRALSCHPERTREGSRAQKIFQLSRSFTSTFRMTKHTWKLVKFNYRFVVGADAGELDGRDVAVDGGGPIFASFSRKLVASSARPVWSHVSASADIISRTAGPLFIPALWKRSSVARSGASA